MSNHRAVFARHFASYLRRKYPSSRCGQNWLIGASELYASETNQSLDIVIDTLNGQREPTRRMMDDLDVEEHFKTRPVTIAVTEKIYVVKDTLKELA